MPIVIQPIFETNEKHLLESTKHRFFSMFTPIQSCTYTDILGRKKTKESDLLAFLATPFIDFNLDAMFALNAAIHALNAISSLCKALYIWTLNQQNTKDFMDNDSAQELALAISSIRHASSMFFAQNLNFSFDIIGLFTRPIVSISKAIIDLTSNGPAQASQSAYPR